MFQESGSVGVHRHGIAIVIALHQQHGGHVVDETQYNSWAQLSSNVVYFFRNWVEEVLVDYFRSNDDKVFSYSENSGIKI